LINLIRRAVVLAEGSWITAENLGLEPRPGLGDPYQGLGLKEAVTKFEASLVTEALTNCGGRVELAAQALKTSRSVIYHLVNKHDLKYLVM
jgi:two-component system NtrC family response regulator